MMIEWVVKREIFTSNGWLIEDVLVEAENRWHAVREAELILPCADLLRQFTLAVVPVLSTTPTVPMVLALDTGRMTVAVDGVPALCVPWMQDSGYTLDRGRRSLSKEFDAGSDKEWLAVGGTVQVMLNGELVAEYAGSGGLYNALCDEVEKHGGWAAFVRYIQDIAAGVPRGRFGRVPIVASRRVIRVKNAKAYTPGSADRNVDELMCWQTIQQIMDEALKVAGDDPGWPGDIVEYLGRMWTIVERDGSQVVVKDNVRRKQARVGLRQVRVLE